MSDLDKKLDETIAASLSIWKAGPSETTEDAPNKMQRFRPNGGELWFFEFDKAAVKQAFRDDGYEKLHEKGAYDTLNKAVAAMQRELLTGQEWYGRFSRELGNFGGVEIAKRGAYICMVEAAKKASGLSESAKTRKEVSPTVQYDTNTPSFHFAGDMNALKEANGFTTGQEWLDKTLHTIQEHIDKDNYFRSHAHFLKYTLTMAEIEKLLRESAGIE